MTKVIRTGEGITLGDVAPDELHNLMWNIDPNDKKIIERLNKQLEEIGKEKGRKSEKHKKRVDALFRTIQDKQNDISKCRSRVADLNNKLQTKTEEQKSSEDQLCNYRETVKYQSDEITRMANKIYAIKRTKVKIIKEDTTHLTDRIHMLEMLFKNLNKTINDDIAERAKMRGVIRKLEEKIKTSNSLNGTLNTTLTYEVKERRKDNQEKQAKIDDLRQKLATFEESFKSRAKKWVLNRL